MSKEIPLAEIVQSLRAKAAEYNRIADALSAVRDEIVAVPPSGTSEEQVLSALRTLRDNNQWTRIGDLVRITCANKHEVNAIIAKHSDDIEINARGWFRLKA